MADTEPFVTVGVRFPRPARATIEGAAAEVGMNVSEWVRMAAYRQLDDPPTQAVVDAYRAKVVKPPIGTNGSAVVEVESNGKGKGGRTVRVGPSLDRRDVTPRPKR